MVDSQLRQIVELSLGSTPEEMLKSSLDTCINLAGASGGSILGEEGPYLQFLFSDVSELIGVQVPFNSIAGATVERSLVIYTFAPADKRHFSGVDAKLSRATRYLLSIPIRSVLKGSGESRQARNAGALQLLFQENIFPEISIENGPREFHLEEFKQNPSILRRLEGVFVILPIVAFGIEVMRLRQTSYQAIHELKNKLISGLSWLSYLKEDIRQRAAAALDDENVKQDFDVTESSMKEGAELAKKYLQFTKIYSPDFVEADVNEVLTEIAASAKALALELKIPQLQVVTSLQPGMGTRQLDTGQLKMAFFNLCKNAIEVLAMFQTPRPELTIMSSLVDGKINITVSDNGPGMPKEIADNLFVAFKTKKEGGTGLGLTITKKIVNVHGGSIRCESGPDGTRFLILI